MSSEAAREKVQPRSGTLLHIHVSLKGRTVRSYTFAHDKVSIGRDPDADIFLDNVGVSREHARFERTPAGFVIEDLGSANGTFLNDKPVQRNLVNDNDIIQIGKYALRVTEKEERRGPDAQPTGLATGAKLEHTTVLTRDQVVKVLSASRTDDDPGERPTAAPQDPHAGWPRGPVLAIGGAACLLCGLAGAIAGFLFAR
jgi:predicted component of type VI protein secretion system